MNERIKELTAQLGEPSTWGRDRPIGPGIAGSRWYGWSDHQQERNGYNTPLYDTAQLKKFAELIVAECAGLFVDQKYMILNPHEPFANERVRALKEHDKDTVRKIKHHFGVDE
jgi:hypothetical protein